MLRFDEVTKTYRKNGQPVCALDRVNLEAESGAFVLIQGPSGSGKSTLLLAAGGMMRPTAGHVWLDGDDVYSLEGARRSRMRAAKVGFVFQQLHLMPYLSVRENILLAARNGAPAARVDGLVEQLGLSHRERHRPAELSVGEKQRVALARAFVNSPPLILADEPTGNLDPENARRVMEHLNEYRLQGAAVIVVSHGADADAFATARCMLRAGRLERVAEDNPHAAAAGDAARPGANHAETR